MGIMYFLLNVDWLPSAKKSGCGGWRERKLSFFVFCFFLLFFVFFLRLACSFIKSLYFLKHDYKKRILHLRVTLSSWTYRGHGVEIQLEYTGKERRDRCLALVATQRHRKQQWQKQTGAFLRSVCFGVIADASRTLNKLPCWLQGWNSGLSSEHSLINVP